MPNLPKFYQKWEIVFTKKIDEHWPNKKKIRNLKEKRMKLDWKHIGIELLRILLTAIRRHNKKK